MKNIKKFEHFLNEALGISEPSLLYLDFLTNYIYSTFEDFYSENTKRDTIKLRLNWPLIKGHITTKDKLLFDSFPIKEFDLKLSLKKIALGEDGRFSIGGGMWPISVKSGSKLYSSIKKDRQGKFYLCAKMDIIININDKIFTDDNLEELYIDLKATIAHELNHAYEHYKRVGNPVNLDKAMDPFIGIVNMYNPDKSQISVDLYDKWIEFCNLLYKSDPHEVNAMTQEMLIYLEDNKLDQETVKENNIWLSAEEMIDFDYEYFYDELLELADGDSKKIELLKNTFIDKMSRELKNYKMVGKSKHDVDRIKNQPAITFMKDYGKVINNSGNRLKRNIIRLFSYEN